MNIQRPLGLIWKHLRKNWSLIIIILGILGAFWLYGQIDIAGLVESFGVENGYLFAFIITLVGGVSTFTSAVVYSTLAVLAGSGALNPFLLGLIGGTAMFMGDSIFFLGTRYVRRKTLDRSTDTRLDALVAKLEKRPQLIPWFVFLYGAFSPFPQDILMLALAILDFPYRKIIIPIWAANIVLITLISLLAQRGVEMLW